MAKPLVLDVIGKDDTAKRVLNDTADGLDKVADGADKADEQLREMAAASDKLTGEIVKTEDAVKRLVTQFAETNDKSLIKVIKKSQRELRDLKSLRDAIAAEPPLPDPIPEPDPEDDRRAEERGRHWADKLVDGIASRGTQISARIAGILGDSTAALPPQVQIGIAGALVAGAAAAGPAIGAVVGGALLGGVGTAGLGAGVVAAFQDPQVQDAAAGVGERLRERLQAAVGDDFVAPTVASMLRLETAAGTVLARVQDEMSGLAPVLTVVADGVGSAVEAMGPGLEDALSAAEPVLRALARELPHLGEDISFFLESISDDPDGAIMALTAALDALGFTIKFVGLLIEGATKITEGWMRLLDDGTSMVAGLAEHLGPLGDATGWLAGKVDDWVDSADDAKDASGDLGDETEELTTKQRAAARAALDHAEKLDLLADTGQSVRLATLDFKDGLAELARSVEENGTSLDINSEKGRDNLRVLESLITNADRAGEAAEKRALAEGKSAEDAAKAGAKMRETYIKDLIAAADKAGLSEKAIKDMVKELREADGQRARVFVDVSVGGSIGSAAAAAARAAVRGMSSGGWVGGDGQPGVDDQLRALSSKEWVASEQGASALERMLGRDGMEQLNATGQIPMLGGGAAGAVGGAAAGAAAGGVIEVVNRVIIEYPDGSVIAQRVTRHGLTSGQRTLEDIFGLPAAA